MKVRVLNAARREEREAAEWYAHESVPAMKRFRAEIKQMLKRIAATPQQFPFVVEAYQRALLKKFPYAIIFEQTEDDLQVVAISHTSREPLYWRKRLSNAPTSAER